MVALTPFFRNELLFVVIIPFVLQKIQVDNHTNEKKKKFVCSVTAFSTSYIINIRIADADLVEIRIKILYKILRQIFFLNSDCI